jgi:hypothetical protein
MITRGIKTEQDRELFEYRPIVTYEKKQGEDINNVVIPKGYNIDDDIKNVINRLPSNMTRQIITFYNKLADVISNIEALLVNSPAIPDASQLQTALAAAEELGIDISDGITYEIYRDIMNDTHNDEYAKQVILDIWRQYHSDVNGSLAGEFYTDLLELSQDVKGVMDFWSRGVIRHIDNNLIIDPSNPSSVLSNLEEKEKVIIDNLILYKQVLDETKTELRTYMITGNPNNPDNIAYDKLNSKCVVVENEYTSLLRKSNVMCEVGDVVSRKVNMNSRSVQLMDDYVKYTPQNVYEGKLIDVLEVLLKGCLENNFLASLKRLRVILKYSVENKSNQIEQNKNKSDAIFSNRVKRVIQDICVKDIGIKVDVCHPLLQTLCSVSDESADAVGKIAETLLNGIQYAEDKYKNDITQLYGAHKSSAESCAHRVSDIYDKQTARDFYNILTIMIDYVENRGSVPNKSSLRQWIINILRNAGLDKIYDYNAGDLVRLDL